MNILVKNEKDKYRGYTFEGLVINILKSYYPIYISNKMIDESLHNKYQGCTHSSILASLVLHIDSNPGAHPDLVLSQERTLMLKKIPSKIGKLAANNIALWFLNYMICKGSLDRTWYEESQHISILNDEFNIFISGRLLYPNTDRDILNSLRAAVFKKLQTLNWLEFHRDLFKFNF